MENESQASSYYFKLNGETVSASTQYDCTEDVLEHKRKVSYWANMFGDHIMERGEVHDDSKLKPPEKELFDKWTPELKKRVFGTDYYKEALDAMGDGLKHHYEVNRHHPEHFPKGVDGMTLIDVLEMVCDWMAAAQARGVRVDLANAVRRFNISGQLADIIWNTLRDVDEECLENGVPVNYLAPEF